MRVTACENGNCTRLFDDGAKCDYMLNESSFMICDYMGQDTGRCMHKTAGQYKKRRTAGQNNDAFYLRSCASAAEYGAKNKNE